MAEGWAKIKMAAKHAGIGERTLRNWLRQGLRHSQLPTGTILIRYGDIDDFLERFAINGNQTDQIVDEVMKGI